MKFIKRKMSAEETVTTAGNDIGLSFPHCQASFNSDGNITLRNYERCDKSKDEIIILSDRETEALFALFSKMGQKNKNYDFPF